MEIRLAFHQGLLSQKSLNRFQQFAGSYHMTMQRRTLVKDINDTLEKFVWYTDDERFRELFFTPAYDADGQVVYDGELAEEVVDDIDEIDRYFEQLDEKKAMSGAQLFSYLDKDERGWI